MKKVLLILGSIGVLFLLIYIFICVNIFSQIRNYNNQVDPLVSMNENNSIVLIKPIEVEDAINKFRSDKGLSTLTDNPILDQAAQERADTMCTDNDWSHKRWLEVLTKYYNYSHSGENLYNGQLINDQLNDAMTRWENSPEHLSNMVGEYTQIGIGVKYCPGFQNRSNDVIITNYFGVPQ